MKRYMAILGFVFVGILAGLLVRGIPIVLHVNAGGEIPRGSQNGDVNGDSMLDMSDAVYLLIHLFNGGPQPAAFAQMEPADLRGVEDSLESIAYNFDQFMGNEKKALIEFEDGKWVMGVYITNPEKSSESLYLMRQLNVALNRDIYRVKRVAFYSNELIKDDVQDLIAEYPRTELINDSNSVLLNVLQKNSKIDVNNENPIFIIDPYGRAVMYFEPNMDPKKILKDLKVLI